MILINVVIEMPRRSSSIACNFTHLGEAVVQSSHSRLGSKNRRELARELPRKQLEDSATGSATRAEPGPRISAQGLPLPPNSFRSFNTIANCRQLHTLSPPRARNRSLAVLWTMSLVRSQV